jgi:hypothetical protein
MLITAGNSRVEDPERLQQFLATTRGLVWTPENRAASLDSLFDAVNSLAFSEILYYYRRRRSLARLSVATRLGAWVFGTAGLLAPLLSVALGSGSEGVTRWGYLLLGLAASLLTANVLFGGSAGHSRSIGAQLELEGRVTLFRIEWYATRAAMGAEPTNEDVASAFSILNDFTSAMYQVLGGETSEWAANLKEAIARYESQIRGDRQ